MAARKTRSSEELQARLKDVEAFILGGMPAKQVAAALSERHGVSEDQIRKDIARLERQWERDGTTREKLMALQGYRKAMSGGKVGQAIAALKIATAGEPTPDGKRAASRFKKLGAPPKNGVRRLAWMQAVLADEAWKVGTDASMKASERRNELIRIGRAMQGLTPYVELMDADDRVRKHLDDLDDDEDPGVEAVDGQESPIRAD